MASGEPFTSGQTEEVNRALARASDDTGLVFSVFVGSPEGPVRDYAERLHAALGDRADRAVLVCVAPEERQVEVVTGKESRRRVTDRACALATMSMTSSFGAGDLVSGIVHGVRMLADSAGRARQHVSERVHPS